jgi:acyl-coenzyme A thioesterase PaaI-like protein
LSFTVFGLRPMAVTSDLAITFLKPAVGGDLLAEATLLRAGRTRLHGRVEIGVEGGDALVAHATGGYALLEER